MKTLALVFNIVSLAFTLLVIAGDGLSPRTTDFVLTVLVFVIPIFTIVALARPSTLPGTGMTTLRLAAISNLVLLAFVCRAVIGHSNEPGFVPYAMLMIFTPLLSAVSLFRFRPNQPAQV